MGHSSFRTSGREAGGAPGAVLGWSILRTLLACCLALATTFLTRAQAPPTFCNAPVAAAVPVLVFTTAFQAPLAVPAGAAQYWRFAAVAGETYGFSTCAGALTFTELRVYDGAGTVVRSSVFQYSVSPYCASGSFKANLDWTCPAGGGGNYWLVMSYFNCSGLFQPSALEYKSTLATPGGAPTAGTFAPGSGGNGTLVTVQGTGLADAYLVRLGGWPAPVLSATATSLTVRVPVGAQSGPLTVLTPFGQATTSASFSVTANAVPALARAEYYLDTDPGLGAATALALPGGGATQAAGLAFQQAVSGLSPGFHTFGTRARDTDGSWGLTTRRSYFVDAAPAATPVLARAEYWLDTDPGLGLATALAVPTGTSDANGLTVSVPLTGLAPGYHTLGVRSQAVGGRWSLTNRRSFFVDRLPTAAPNLRRAEYFLDNDPGRGLGTPLPLPAGQPDSGPQTFAVSVSSLTPGFHSLTVRVQDTNGAWSLSNRQIFFLDTTPPLANLRRTEYWLDTDPGLGLATAVPLPGGTADAAGLNFAVSLSAVSSGFHTLGIRSQGANGVWGLTNRRAFFYDNLAAAPNLTQAEYWLDTDPGLGLATALALPAGTADANGVAAAIALPANLPTGLHTLGLRTRAGGRWSLTNRRSFFYEAPAAAPANIVRAEFFVDNADPGLGLATAIPLGAAGPDRSGTGTGPALTTLADGPHRLSVRSRDATGRWGLTHRQHFLKNGCVAALNTAAVAPGAPSTTTATGNFNYVPSRAFDQSAPTFDSFQFSGPVIVTHDLGTARTLREVRYTLRPAAATTAVTNISVQVQTTTDFLTWTTQDSYAPILPVGQASVVVGRRFAAPASGVVGLRLNLNMNPANAAQVQLHSFGSYDFNVCTTLPAIASFTPTTGPAATSVEITGTNLTGATQVLFNGTAAGSFVVNSATSITATAPAGGTTGQLTVVTPQGTAYSAGSYAYPPALVTIDVPVFGSRCTSNLFQVNFRANIPAFGPTNTFRFQLSDNNGVFSNTSRLYGALNQFITTSGTSYLRDSVAFRTPSGTGYKFRVVSSDPVVYGDPTPATSTIYAPPAAVVTSTATSVPYQGSFTLTATPAGLPFGNYSWFLSRNGSSTFYANGQTFTISGPNVTAGNFSGLWFCRVQNPNPEFCTDSASVRVRVLPPGVPVLSLSPSFAGSRCAGSQQQFFYGVSGTGFNAGNVITAQLSDGSGSFAAPTALVSVPFSGTGGGSLTITFPPNTPAGSSYRVRLVGSNPATIGEDNGYPLTIVPAPTAAPTSNSPVTYPAPVQLTTPAVANASYQWTGPNGFSSTLRAPTVPLTQTFVGTNTYQVVVTAAGGLCPATATTSVTVNPSPVPIVSMFPGGESPMFGGNANGPTFCTGNLWYLRYGALGNSFPAGNVMTGELSDASGSFAAPTLLGTQAYSGQGPTSLYFNLPNVPTGLGYRFRIRSSNPVTTTENGTDVELRQSPPAVASSNSPVPFGGTLRLSTPAVAGATYQWTGPNGFTSALREPVITGATQFQNQGTYQVRTTLNTCFNTATTNVSVSPSTDPILSFAQFSGTLCGGTVLNTGFLAQGNNFLAGNVITGELSDGNGSFASPSVIGTLNFVGQGTGSILLTLPVLVPSNSRYRIRLTGSNPAGVVSINDNGSDLVLKPQADATAGSNSPVPAGADINLSANVVAGAGYQWSGPAGFTSTLANPQIQNATAANAGTYTLSVTFNGCQRVSQTTVVVGTAATTLAVTQFGGQFCPGSSVLVPFTASGFSSGNVFTAQLSDNAGQFGSPMALGSVAGTGSGSLTVTFPTNTPAGTGYRIRVVASAPSAVSSTDNGQNLTIIPTTFVWTGGANTVDWFSPLNWSCGQIPTSTSVVVIPGGLTYYPVVASGPASAGTLTVNLGATLTVSTTFNLYGNVTVTGTVLGGIGSGWNFAGGTAQFVFGANPLQVWNLTLASGTVLNLNTGLNVGGNWTNNGGSLLAGTQVVGFNGGGVTQVIGGTAGTSFGNVLVASGANVALGFNTVFGNNLTVNGGFAAGTFNIVLNGTVAQTIGGSGTTTFYGLTINNLLGVSLLSNITVLGDWINNGVFVGGTFGVIFAGTGAQIIGGTAVTNFYDLTLQNPVSVTLHQNIYVLGGFANTGVFYGYYNVGSVTNGFFVRFGGTVAQVINANLTTYFYHFYVDNLTGVSLSTNIYIAGNYYLYSGSFAPGTFTVFFNGTGGLVQTVGGYTNLSFYGWNIVSGAYVRLIQNVTWLGSFVNAGTFYGYNLVGGVYTYFTSTFGGTVAQLINGGGVYEFGHVTIANLVVGGVTFNVPIYVFGNWLNNGVFYCGTGTIYFNGQLAQTIGGSVGSTFYHVSIGNLISVSLNQAIVVTGNWFGTGVFLGNGFLTYFNGTAAQTILTGLNTRFAAIRFNNAASVTLLSNIYLNGNWTNDGGFIAGGFGVYFSGNSLQLIAGAALSVFHHVVILNLAQVQINRVITVTGDWTNSGSFLANLFTVTFSGTVAQVIGGGTVSIFHGITFTNLVGVTLAQHIRVRGGWLNNGVFIPATFIVYFDGSAAQVIGGTAVSNTFFGLNILNTVGVSLSGPIFIRGNLVNDGLFTCVGHLVTFNGAVLQTIGGLSTTIFGSVTMNNAVGIALGQNIRVRGDFRNLGLFTAGGFIVYFDGTAAQGIFCPSGTLTFHDVVFANPLGVTLQHNISVTGNWTNNGGFVANGQRVTFAGTVLQTIGGTVATTFHHFVLLTGATVRQLLGLTILGDWTNGGLFQHNSLLVYFHGTTLQTIGGTALTVFYDLTLDNPVNVSLNFDIDVVRHFVNNGRFCGCGHRVRFNGTVPQTIACTSGNTHFHDITFANAAGVTLLDGIYVGGLWVNNGGYLANNQLVVFDGTALQTIGGTVLTAFHNIGITNAVNVQLLRDITVGGYWNNTGSFGGNGFLVTFNGTALQTITTSGAGITRFHHVTWANLVGCVLGGDIHVLGNWLCNGPFDPATYTVYFDGILAQTCGGSSQLNFYNLTCSNPLGISFADDVYLTHDFVNTGLVNCGPNSWYCTGSTAQTLGGASATPTRFYDLFVRNAAGVTCTHNLFVTHLVRLDQGNLASANHLTLTSNATGTAMVVNPAGGGEITGVATMERFITGVGSVGYRHYASPMKRSASGVTTTVQQFADDLPVFNLNPAYNTLGNTVTPFPTFFRYDEARLTAARPGFDEGWLTPAAADDLEPLRGYAAMTDPTTTVDLSGVLQNGPVSLALTRGGISGSGFQLLGNPYPAPLDWDVARATPGMLTNVADALYVFQPSGRYTGSYKSYVNGLGQNGGTKDVAAMQGFFVRSTGTGSISLTNAVRPAGYASPAFNRQAGTGTGGPARPVLRLSVAPENRPALDDETVLYFEAGSALGFSPRHDAYKVQLNGSGRPSVWTIASSAPTGSAPAPAEAFAISGLPDLATAPVVPLAVRVSVTGRHVLDLSALALPAGTQVWLEDRALNRRQNLAATPRYLFDMDAAYAGQRFYLNLVAGRPTAVTSGALAARLALFPNPATATATVELSGLGNQPAARLTVLNALGQCVLQATAPVRQGALSATLNLGGLPTGIYTVRIATQEGTATKRLVKE